MPNDLFDNLDNIFVIDNKGEMVNSSPITIKTEPIIPLEDKTEPVKTEPVKDDTSIDLSELITLEPEGTKEEDKLPVETTEEKEPTEEEIQSSMSEGIKSTAKFLKDSEILNDVPEDFDGSIEAFKDLFFKEDETRRNEIREEFTKDFPPILKELAERWEEGVPLDQLIDIKSNQIRYSNIQPEKLEESESLQENVLRDYYKKTTRYSDEKIDREIKRLKDLDELKEEATNALPELKQIEVDNEKQVIELTRRQQVEIETKHRETIKKYEDAINSISEIIPGFKPSDKEKKELFKTIITPVAVDGNNRPLSEMAVERQKDPINFDIKLNYFLKKTNFLKDFSKFMTAAETKAATKIETSLESTTKKSGTKTGTPVEGMNTMFEALAKMSKNRIKK